VNEYFRLSYFPPELLATILRQ